MHGGSHMIDPCIPKMPGRGGGCTKGSFGGGQAALGEVKVSKRNESVAAAERACKRRQQTSHSRESSRQITTRQQRNSRQATATDQSSNGINILTNHVLQHKTKRSPFNHQHQTPPSRHSPAPDQPLASHHHQLSQSPFATT